MPRTAQKNHKPSTKLEKTIIPFLFDNPDSSAADIQAATGVTIQPTYLFAALNDGKLVKSDEPVRSGKRGRPANRYKLAKNTRDAERRRRNKVAQSEVEPVAEPVAV